MTTGRKILSNTAAQVIGKVLTALLGVISIKLITNYLTKSQYGEYTAIYDYTAIFAIVADFGLFVVAVREMAKSSEMIEKILGNVLSVRTVLGIASLGLGILIAFFIPAYKESMIPIGIGIVSISTLMMLTAGTISSVLQLHLKMHWAAFALVFGKLVTVLYIAATIFYLYPNNPDKGFIHLLYAWIIGLAFTLLITYFPSRRLAAIRYRFDFDFWKEVIFQTLPYGLALLFGSIYFRTGSVLLSFFGMKDAVGIYGVAIRIVEIAVLIPAYFMNSILPILTQSLSEARGKTLRILQYSFDFMSLSAFPMLLGGLAVAPLFIAAVSSKAFVGGAGSFGSDTVFSILLFGMTFVFFHNIFNYTLVSMGLQRKVLLINFFAALLNVAFNLILIPRFSFMGAASIAAATELFVLACSMVFVVRLLKFKPKLLLGFKAFTASAIMAIAVAGGSVFLKPLLGAKSLLILIPAAAIVYFGLLLLFRTFTPEIIGFLKKQPKDVIASD